MNSNFFLSHFVFNVHFGFLSYFFYYFFKDQSIKKLILTAYLIFVFIIILQTIINPEIFWTFNLFEILASSFLIIIYSFLAIYKVLDYSKPKYFFLCTGIIIYFISNSIIHAAGELNVVFLEKPVFIDLWIFSAFSYIVFQYFIFKEWQNLTYAEPR